jgi:hypothetical protein
MWKFRQIRLENPRNQAMAGRPTEPLAEKNTTPQSNTGATLRPCRPEKQSGCGFWHGCHIGLGPFLLLTFAMSWANLQLMALRAKAINNR